MSNHICIIEKRPLKKEIAITFDDWAHEQQVKAVLDVLKKI
ncbi:hypothetical protein OL548_31850 [Lysinibacillus sp. MHQ-1]|nr:hypothetical protein OL548_31850 [Lysinibacillus sp. MHQ-1]